MRMREIRHCDTRRHASLLRAFAFIAPATILIVCLPAVAGESPPHWFRDWTVINAPDALPHDDVRAIEMTPDAVWVGTRGGLARLHDDKWQHWRKADGLPIDWISAIAFDKNTRDLWIGTWGAGLVRYTAGRFDTFNQLNSGIAGNLVFDIAVEGRRVWIATNGGISCFDPASDTWALFEAKRADSVQEAYTSVASDGRHLWTTAWCGPLRSLDLSRVDMEETPDSARFNATVAMVPSFGFAQGTKRHAWATMQGIRAFDANTAFLLLSFDLNLSVASSIVHCMTIAPEDVLWAGCGDGLIAADLQGNTAIHYYIDGKATLYRNNNRVETKHIRWMLPASTPRCIAADSGGLWIGTDRGLVRATTQIAWEDIPREDKPRASEPARPTTTTAPATGTQSSPPANLHRGETPTIDIAVLGPIEQTIGLPGESADLSETSKRGDVLAVQMAMQQVNAGGGFRDQRRFAAASSAAGYDRYGWTTPEDEFYIFAERPNVVGLIGEIEPENRVACYVALESEVPMVNTTSRSRPNHEWINPWIFRCPRNDYDTHQRLLDTAALAAKGNRFAIVKSDDVEEEAHLAMWRLAAARSDAGVMGEASWKPDDAAAMQTVDTLIAQNPDVLLTWCDAATSAAILEHANAAGWRGAFVGSDWIVCDELIEAVGESPSPILAIRPGSERPSRTEFERFVQRYARQSSPVKRLRPPTAAAIANYDATLLMLAAVNEAGPDRDAVRVALSERSRPYIVRWRSGKWAEVGEKQAPPVGHTELHPKPLKVARPPAFDR